MKARPLRSRADLLELVAQHPPTKACATALGERRSTVLGGFTPTEGLPCWIILVKSWRGREWIIAVECDEAKFEFNVKYLDAVPWKCWAGKIGGRNPLIDGDSPDVYALNRLNARRTDGR